MLYRYVVTGNVSYPFTQEVLAEDEDDAVSQVEAMGADVEVESGEPSMDIDNVREEEPYRPKGGSPLDDPDKW